MPNSFTPVHSASAVQKELRKTYAPPQLVCYGSVSALTQYKSGRGSESGGGSGNVKDMATSDMRLKHNIVRIGQHPQDFGIYLFDYKPEFAPPGQEGRQWGVMAQEVELVMPEAVETDADGYKRVNYALLGIHRTGQRLH